VDEPAVRWREFREEDTHPLNIAVLYSAENELLGLSERKHSGRSDEIGHMPSQDHAHLIYARCTVLLLRVDQRR
jgi:hypothetical protein